MSGKVLNYIATTQNGYIFEKVKICDYDKLNWDDIYDYLSYAEIETEHDGVVNYFDDIAGDLDAIEEFLKYGTNKKCTNKDYHNSKSNVLMEDWRTEILGWYTDMTYVGLQISDKRC